MQIEDFHKAILGYCIWFLLFIDACSETHSFGPRLATPLPPFWEIESLLLKQKCEIIDGSTAAMVHAVFVASPTLTAISIACE